MKAVIIYHMSKPGTKCPDGACASWIVFKYLTEKGCEEKNIELIGECYLNESEYVDRHLPFEPASKEVYIVDFVYPKFILEAIANKASKLVIIDHHDGKDEVINNISNFSNKVLGVHNLDECGATLTWKTLFPDREEPWFLRHVLSRDTGKWGFYDRENPLSRAVTAKISSLCYEMGYFPAFDYLNSFTKDISDAYEFRLLEGFQKDPDILEEEALISTEISAWNQDPAFIEIAGHTVPYLHIKNKKCDRLYSWVGAELGRLHKNTFVAIRTKSDESNAISLRRHSSNPINLRLIANQYGGGGHPPAAGFRAKEIQETFPGKFKIV